LRCRRQCATRRIWWTCGICNWISSQYTSIICSKRHICRCSCEHEHESMRNIQYRKQKCRLVMCRLSTCQRECRLNHLCKCESINRSSYCFIIWSTHTTSSDSSVSRDKNLIRIEWMPESVGAIFQLHRALLVYSVESTVMVPDDEVMTANPSLHGAVFKWILILPWLHKNNNNHSKYTCVVIIFNSTTVQISFNMYHQASRTQQQYTRTTIQQLWPTHLMTIQYMQCLNQQWEWMVQLNQSMWQEHFCSMNLYKFSAKTKLQWHYTHFHDYLIKRSFSIELSKLNSNSCDITRGSDQKSTITIRCIRCTSWACIYEPITDQLLAPSEIVPVAFVNVCDPLHPTNSVAVYDSTNPPRVTDESECHTTYALAAATENDEGMVLPENGPNIFPLVSVPA